MYALSVVAHVDHGKTTLLDSILSHTRIISRASAGQLRYLDSREDEQERGITLKLSFFQAENFVFIDTPGHIDFASLIECSSRLCDFFIFIVDVNEGITPRTLSLLNLMRSKKCVLVLNKVDKLINSREVLYKQLNRIIESMNVFLNDEYFAWSKNNIIICCSISLYGLNYNVFKKIKENNTVKDAIAFIFLMCANSTDLKIKEKKAKLSQLLRNRKIEEGRLENIFPLSDSVFDSLSNLVSSFNSELPILSQKDQENYENGRITEKRRVENEGEAATYDNAEQQRIGNAGETNSYQNRKITGSEGGMKRDEIYLREFPSQTEISNTQKDAVSEESIIGITTYAIEKGEEILFVTKIFADVEKDMAVFSNVSGRSRECKIEKIYEFNGNKLVHVRRSVAPNIIAIKSNFERNSVLTLNRYKVTQNVLKARPFYIKKIKPRIDLTVQIRRLSFFEPILRAKMNKFGEIELLCEGHMHFEKISQDLNFEFDELPFYDAIYEGCGEMKSDTLVFDDLKVYVKIDQCENKENDVIIEYEESVSEKREKVMVEPSENVPREEDTHRSNDNGNECTRKSSRTDNAITNEMRNAIGIFSKKGILLNEKICFTSFSVEIKGKYSENLLAKFLKMLSSTYESTTPTPILFYYRCKLSITEEYLGRCYKLLNKYHYKLISNDFDEKNEFFIVEFHLRRRLYNEFHDELKCSTRGTFYLHTMEEGYLRYDDEWNDVIESERKRKGMHKEEVLVSEPEKQRTLKK